MNGRYVFAFESYASEFQVSLGGISHYSKIVCVGSMAKRHRTHLTCPEVIGVRREIPSSTLG